MNIYGTLTLVLCGGVPPAIHHKYVVRIGQIQANTASLQTDNEDLRSPGILLEFGDCGRLFLNVHRSIKPIVVKAFSLQDRLYEIHKARKLGEHDGPEAWILVP